jgi:hypothetical protein
MIGHNTIQDNAFRTYQNFIGYTGVTPTTEDEYTALLSEQEVFTGTAPSWSELSVGISNEIARDNRKNKYPPMEDYLDGIVKADQAQIDKYIADCQTVKNEFPLG